MTVAPQEDSWTLLLSQSRMILEQSGQGEAALVLSRLSLAFEEPEQWSLSGRTVEAYRAVLLCPGDLILRLRSEARLRDQLQAALAAAFDRPGRVLRAVSVMLQDNALQLRSDENTLSSHPYRDTTPPASLPHPAVLLDAAQRYAATCGSSEAAEILSRARVEIESGGSSSSERYASIRLTILLGLEDVARVSQDAGLRQRVTSALRDVASGPRRVLGEVAVGVDWCLPVQDQPAAPLRSERRVVPLLQDLLAAEGIASAVVATHKQGVRLVVSLQGQLGVIDLRSGPQGAGTLQLLHLQIDPTTPDWAEVARSVRRALSPGTK